MKNMKQKPIRLTDSERLSRRQHQIDLGKATQGHRNLVVLRSQGIIPEGPKTPDPKVKISKRQFDKEIREWRRKLHAFDNVDFNSLKSASSTPSSHSSENDYVQTLIGKDMREAIHSSRPRFGKEVFNAGPKNNCMEQVLWMENQMLKNKLKDSQLSINVLMERLRHQEVFIQTLLYDTNPTPLAPPPPHYADSFGQCSDRPYVDFYHPGRRPAAV